MTDQFLEWLRRDRNYSPNTIAAYRRVLATINDPETATRDDVEDWWLDRDHLSPATRRQETTVSVRPTGLRDAMGV